MKSPGGDGPTPQAGAADLAKLAEAALRNLHMDCHCPPPDGREFSSRMMFWRNDELVGSSPLAGGKPVFLRAGQELVCSCKLGQEVLRFAARVAGLQMAPDGVGTDKANLRLTQISSLQVVQRRRYYRIPLAARQPSQVTVWLVDQRLPGSPKVCSKLDGQLLDLSSAGAGLLLSDEQGLLEHAQDFQMWVRFTLPGENESLIFRATPRHVDLPQPEGRRVGLEFVEYIEPGSHKAVIQRLANFSAGQAS
jgi:hypothetical protein